MTKTRFNINYNVRVRLNPVGRRIIAEHEAKINAHLLSIGGNPTYFYHVVEDADGWSKWQLWQLMRMFGGEHMIQGASVPFDTEIEIELLDEVSA